MKTIDYEGPQGIALESIDKKLRPASEMRVGLNTEAIAEYAQSLTQLPPVKLMRDAKADVYWVVDGAHTITAFRGTSQQIIQAVVTQGDYLKAFRAASHENNVHGVRITSADKRARVKQAAKTLPELVRDWPWTERRLAEFCGVSHTFLQNLNLPCFHVATVATTQAASTGQGGKVYIAVSQPATTSVQSNGQTATSTTSTPTISQTASSSPEKKGPSPFDVLSEMIQKNRLMIGSVEAKDSPQRKGWGGFQTVVSSFTKPQRKQLFNSLVGLVESLQEWIDHLKELDSEIREDKDGPLGRVDAEVSR